MTLNWPVTLLAENSDVGVDTFLPFSSREMRKCVRREKTPD